MRLLSFVAQNLLHRPARSALTVVGLGVTLGAVVTLTGISANFERSFLAMYRAKGIDLVAVRAGVSNRLSSTLDAGLAPRIAAVEGVAGVGATLMDTVSFDESNLAAVLANGWESDSLLYRGLRIIEGRALGPDDDDGVLLGRILALNLGKEPGDAIEIVGEPFRVVGVFESDSLFENGGLVVSIATLQKMMGREGQVTGFVISTRSTDAVAIAATARRIEAAVGGVAAVPARDYVRADVQIGLAKAMSWATAAVALTLGTLGLLNTMMMAVFERTRDIGVLRALGWRRARVLTLMLAESLALGVAGSVLGMMLGGLGTMAITLVPTARGFIEPMPPPEAYGSGLALGLTLSLVGGLYPAWRAATLEPTAALRHE